MTESTSPETDVTASTDRYRCTPAIPKWPALAAGRAVWTGHQPRFWHPGILAKYLAADQALTAAGDRDTPLHHLVVDQDVQNPLALDVPTLQADALGFGRVRLGPVRVDVPTGRQPAVAAALPPLPPGTDPRAARGLQLITHALQRHADQPTLAWQVTHALHELLTPHLGRKLRAHPATDFAQAPWFNDEIDRLLHDAERCVAFYNHAVAQHPDAGIAPLRREPFRVELPLWHLSWNAPRQRVYADLADTRPLLTVEDGTPISDAQQLAPRALMMTAWLRRPGGIHPECGLFVHGTGGGRYERITDAWWTTWRGESLTPIAVATADQRLRFDAPVHTSTDHQRAVWFAHHLPHNPEGALALHPPAADTRAQALIQEKNALLASMHQDRHKPRRRKAFHRIKQINKTLCAQAPQALQNAQAHVDRTRQGLVNATVAGRRNWPFVYHTA